MEDACRISRGVAGLADVVLQGGTYLSYFVHIPCIFVIFIAYLLHIYCIFVIFPAYFLHIYCIFHIFSAYLLHILYIFHAYFTYFLHISYKFVIFSCIFVMFSCIFIIFSAYLTPMCKQPVAQFVVSGSFNRLGASDGTGSASAIGLRRVRL